MPQLYAIAHSCTYLAENHMGHHAVPSCSQLCSTCQWCNKQTSAPCHCCMHCTPAHVRLQHSFPMSHHAAPSCSQPQCAATVSARDATHRCWPRATAVLHSMPPHPCTRLATALTSLHLRVHFHTAVQQWTCPPQPHICCCTVCTPFALPAASGVQHPSHLTAKNLTTGLLHTA